MDFGAIFGLDFSSRIRADDKTKDLLEVIVGVREKLREKKEWELSDIIRSRLRDLDINLED